MPACPFLLDSELYRVISNQDDVGPVVSLMDLNVQKSKVDQRTLQNIGILKKKTEFLPSARGGGVEC